MIASIASVVLKQYLLSMTKRLSSYSNKSSTDRKEQGQSGMLCIYLSCICCGKQHEPNVYARPSNKIPVVKCVQHCLVLKETSAFEHSKQGSCFSVDSTASTPPYRLTFLDCATRTSSLPSQLIAACTSAWTCLTSFTILPQANNPLWQDSLVAQR